MAPEVLTDTLLARAERTPEVVGYDSVDPSGIDSLSYAQLAARATAVAHELATADDGPVLLAYPAGLDYLVAVFGAFLAGRPVIPAFPPTASSRPEADRLAGIVADARPPVVIAPQAYAEIAVPKVLTVPGAEADGTAPDQPRRVAGDDVAVIQYTSGSTGRPRGVLVRHGSLVANTAAIAERFELDSESRAVTWLPPFHDMGLVGGLLTPLTAGIPMRVMRPADFLKAPLLWLRQISELGATHSGSPNFGYDLCVRRARNDEALAGLDLTRWRVAFSGGETVRYRTMTRFAARFAAAGFRPQTFLPCYGLAEATLIVSAGHWSGPTDTDTAADADPVVSCGTPVRGQQVVVVDLQTRSEVDDGVEGEIWIAGPHVTSGYLSGDAGELFADRDGVQFLRTGDLGCLRGGELFLSGRAKDVIVYRGVNYHAVDVEAAALDAIGRTGRTAAAFLVESGPEPLPVLVVEAHGTRDEATAARLRAAVLERAGLRLGVVALVPPNSLPRTSSGKVRRAATRHAFLSGGFADAVAVGEVTSADAARGGDREAAAGELATLVCGIVAAVCEVGDCRPTDNLVDLGFDSVRAAEAAAVLEHALGLQVPVEKVLTVPTPAGLADALVGEWLAEGRTADQVRERMTMVDSGAGVV